MKKSKIITPMMTFMAGAVTGMMFAPEKGEDLRKDVANKVKKMKKEECEMIDGVATEIKEKTKDMKRIIEE